MTCAHSEVVKIVYESRWQKHWECSICGEEFYPESRLAAMKAELDQFKQDAARRR